MKKVWLRRPEYWFAIGLTLTTATKFRLPSFPLGFGEVILAFWTLATIIFLLKSGKIYVSTVAKILVFFWFSIFLFLIIGSVTTIYLGHYSNISYRNFLAYGFISLLFITFSFSIKQNFVVQMKKIARLTFSFTTLPLIFMYIYSFSFTTLGSIIITNVRFGGWATNPNQIALVTAVLLFVGIYNFTQSKKNIQKIWYGLLTLGLLLVGIATESDALNVALMIGVIMLAFLYWYSKVFNHEKLSYWKGAWLKLLMPLMLISFSLILGSSVYTSIQHEITNISDDGDQGSVRFALWRNGWEAIKSSPFIGLGPGAFSGVDSPFRGMEAHNTFIDLGTNTGLFGIVIYISLILWTAWLAWSRKEYVLFTGIITLTLYSAFHFVLRHPLYWFYLLLVISICRNSLINPGNSPTPQLSSKKKEGENEK